MSFYVHLDLITMALTYKNDLIKSHPLINSKTVIYSYLHVYFFFRLIVQYWKFFCVWNSIKLSAWKTVFTCIDMNFALSWRHRLSMIIWYCVCHRYKVTYKQDMHLVLSLSIVISKCFHEFAFDSIQLLHITCIARW